MNPFHPMNFRLLLCLALLAPAAIHAQHPGHAKAEASKTEAKLHPLTGVVVDVLADQESLLVKHDEIPGVMRAMTMMFRVDADVLTKVKKGDAIKAKMGRDESGKWILRDVAVQRK
jgi:Cu/Ag efflux protein CusF